MDQVVLIVHGWSDCSGSFKGVKQFLKGRLGKVSSIYFGDYASREDSLTFSDVTDGLNDEMIRRGFIGRDGKALVELNVVVHSTGGLVIRDWIARYYGEGSGRKITDCPVKRLVMLAPANFGSPLAHRGKSFLGQLFKGRWKLGDFLEVGRNLLEGLELGSPYQWKLAHRDLLVEKPYFNAEQIQATVLVGVEDYTGLRGWVNKPGTDGTVVIAGTSLDTMKLKLDFSKERGEEVGEGYTPFEWEETNPPEEFGFGVLMGLDHGSIVDQAGEKTEVGELLARALTTSGAAEFKALVAELQAVTKATYEKVATGTKDRPARRPFQQFIVHAVDEYGESIPDFTMEFQVRRAKHAADALVTRDLSVKQGKEHYYSDVANRQILGEIHAHSVDPSYRRLLVDPAAVKDTLDRAANDLKEPVVLSMRLYVPARDRGIRYDVESLQNIVLFDPSEKVKGPKLFFENTTTLIELCVNRLCDYVTIGETARDSD